MNRQSASVEAAGSGVTPGVRVQELGPGRFGVTVGLRLLNTLALALPLGGLAFFGIFAAPAMFRVARAAGHGELAPQMVAQMLGRFGFVLIACGLLAMACWALDRPRLSTPDARRARLWWAAQGAASLVVLATALFLHLGLMPRILAMQGQVLGEASAALRASFDAAHQGYSRGASVLLWSALFALGCLARRGARG